MKIGIDACTWSNRRGYGRFTRELVTNMIEHHPRHDYVLVVDQQTADQCDFPAGTELEVVATREQPTAAAAADGSRDPRDLWRMSREVRRLPLDAFVFPTNYTFFPMLRRIPTVVVFHDVLYDDHTDLILPNWKARLFWNAKCWLARRQADRIVTVSEDARKQIAKAFRCPESTIPVISEGPGSIFTNSECADGGAGIRRSCKLPPETPLVLYVGGISPHKNIDGLLQAMSRIPQDTADGWHLVLVGDYQNDSFLGCHESLKKLTAELGLEDRVTFTGFVSDEDLAQLYHAATLLVMPSLGEGFGLPVVEAMACHLPVAASDRNSLPEVVGNAGVLFDPTDPDDMAKAIRRLLSDDDLRRDLVAKGIQRVETYSWKTGAAEMIRVLEDLAEDG